MPTAETEIPGQVPAIDWWGLLSPILFSWQLVVFLVLLGFGVRFWWRKFDHHRVDRARHLLTPGSASASTVERWGRKANRKQGMASLWDILWHASALPMWRKATIVAPRYKHLSRWQRLRLPVTAVAIRLARVGFLHVWSSHEDVTLLFGGPRTGKSAMLGGAIIDYPGPVLVTSTRLDLLDATRKARSRKGVVYVFNPAGLGDEDNTIAFDPLVGCDNLKYSDERATDLMAAVSNGGSSDREYWEGQGRRVLKVLLHAAALGRRDNPDMSMQDVLRWCADPEKAEQELVILLKRSPMPALIQDLAQFVGTNDKTRSSITSTIMPTLQWLSDPSASVAGSAAGGRQLDIHHVIAQNATVYMIGRDEAGTAPLLSAMTGYLAREALRLAGGHRLEPSLGLFLDEAAQVSPVPLASWTADFGGSGITIVAAFQGLAQVEKRWGLADRKVIMTNAASILFFGGDKDAQDLEAWSKLAGDRDEITVNRDKHGKVTGSSTRKVPILPPSRLRSLPRFRVLVLRIGLAPCIGRIERYWKRPDVKHPDGHPVVLMSAAAVGWFAAQHRARQQARSMAEVAAQAAFRAQHAPAEQEPVKVGG